MRFTGFIGPTYQLSSRNADCQRCMNLYPEVNEIGTGKDKEIASFVECPGLNLLATMPANGNTRGDWLASTGDLYYVNKNKFYKFAADSTVTELGTLVTSSGRVSMADNGLQLVVVDGPNGYVWDFTLLTFVQINDPAWLGSTTVAYQDGTFLFHKPGTNQFYISGLNEVTFDAADVAEKEGNADPIVAIFSDHRNVWLWGTETIEVWYNSGAALFPFQRIDGTYSENGLAAAFSIQKLNGTIIWLGQDKKGTGIVYMANQYTPVRISTQAIEDEIQSYSTISDATSWTYQDGGHSFYVLNFPTANASWCYDIQTRLWHERSYLNQGRYDRHRAETHSFTFGKHIVADWENGNIYELSRDFHTDNGAPKKWMRRAPHISTDMVRQFFQSFQIDIEAGVGLDGTGQGTDPKVILRWSDDGGHKWSNERWVSMGKIGHTKHRAKWERLGSARDRVFEVSGTDPVKIAIIGAELNYQPGAA